MDLLSESKKIWLGSYLFNTLILFLLYRFAWDKSIGKTIGIMFFGMQILIVLFFVKIVVFGKIQNVRTLPVIIYLGFVIYEGMKGNLHRWYIIIPIFLIASINIIWNLGGVSNCIIASPIRKCLNSKVEETKQRYNEYYQKLKEYNERNQLGYWTKIKVKKAPDWERMGFHYTALWMFIDSNAIVGVDFSECERKLSELNEMAERLNEKLLALHNNDTNHQEMKELNKMINRQKKLGRDVTKENQRLQDCEVEMKINMKKEKKVLKRGLKRWLS